VKSDRGSTRADLRALMRQAHGGASELDEAVMECSLDELQEFLEADLADVPVDREFKQNLREKLWDLVQTRNRQRSSTDAN